MTTPKISLHDALLAIKEHFELTTYASMTISLYPGDLSPRVAVDEKRLSNPLWEEGKYERELGFPVVPSTPKTYVAYDNEGGWSSTVEANSPQEALELFLDYEEYDWCDGATLCLAEQIMCGTVKTKIEFVEDGEANQDTPEVMDTPAPKETQYEMVGLLPEGTILESLVDCPVGIDYMSRGDRAVVLGDSDSIVALKDITKRKYYGRKLLDISEFRKTWKILYTPTQTSEPVNQSITDYDILRGVGGW